ncbi:FERM domain-containing protein 5-like isoform X2 [Stegodyphus dumicola]|uniref:FERM domain-containing protein 5-like isoform X2 n=1 Tax=Stegodyphus dumicola TaxID=202533 RepID=UPI0015A93BE1|nr:FERM domain-containing protein 5-like isoform X2 [Stegodyphus dumicola]
MFKFGSKKEINIDYKCTIRLLDDTEVLQCDFQSDYKGQYLLDYTCKALNLIEKDYFGLRYVDSHKQRHWLDPTKSILKQVKGMNPIVFCFRVKFYPQDPYRLREEITRYQIFLQLRRDLLHGRLYCSQSDAALLAAYIIQSELGDYDPDEHPPNYVSEFKLLLKQTQRLEEKIIEIHQTLRGQVPAVAEMNFLRKACLLDTYGVDPHPVKDHKGNQLYLGINYAGILTFQGSRKTHHLKWPDIQKINYEGKMFIVHLLFSEKKHLIGFKCPTQAACHHLWKCAVEQRYFFTMESSSEVPTVTTSGGIFSRGCKFRYSGRVEKEIMEDTKQIKREQPQFQRSFTRPPSLRKIDSYMSSPCTSPHDDHIMNDYNGMLYSNHSGNDIHPNINDQDNIQVNRNVTSPTLSSIPADGLDILEEECDSYSPTDTMHSESPTFNSNQVSCDNSISRLNTEEGNREDSDTAEELPESMEVISNSYQAPVYRQSEDVVPLDVKIPKRKVPMAPSTTLPLHVNIMRVVVLASLFVLLLLSCLLIVVMESDSSLFSDIRKLPEMIILRREYYEPAKDYIVEQMNFLFKR